ncbi:hypothetical protein D3Z52_04010 [Clostridiaceae bacterium]|nr:hypothetical protein [Clostridiaceae bacterium]
MKSGERSAGGIPFPVREEKFFAFFSKISQKSGFAAKDAQTTTKLSALLEKYVVEGEVSLAILRF